MSEYGPSEEARIKAWEYAFDNEAGCGVDHERIKRGIPINEAPGYAQSLAARLAIAGLDEELKNL